MREFFGADMTVLASILAGLLLVALATVFFLAARNRILVKLALRNIPRRPAQTILIVAGLMLSTVIISASLSIGDTVAGSIRGTVLDALGETDIRIRSATGAGNAFGDNYIDPADQLVVIDAALEEDGVDGVLPQIREVLPVLNSRSQLTEARMLVVGLDPDRTSAFDVITSTSGELLSMQDLGPGEVYLNERAANEIEGQAGDRLTVVTPSGRHDFTIKALVQDGGLAANDRRILLSLSDMQRIMEREGQVNRIDVSLETGREGSASLSESVTDALRLQFIDREKAGSLFNALRDQQVVDAIRDRVSENPGGTITDSTEEDLNELVDELVSGSRPSDRFMALAAKPQVAGQVIAAVEASGMTNRALEITGLFLQIELFAIDEIKQDGLQLAEFIGNIFVTFFSIFGSFSIIVGLLLIFLVFVMLAAERSSEMGIARAIGTKRRHLVQMFTFEGVAYSIGAAIVGTVIGLIASRLIVVLLVNAVQGSGDEVDFEFRFTTTVTSVIAGFSLGLLLTLLTVGVSAFRVSKLNIVVAIRGLPAEFLPSETQPFAQRLRNLGKALISPVWQLFLLVVRSKSDRIFVADFGLLIAFLLIIPWVLNILLAVWKIVSPGFGSGIPQVGLGLIGSAAGINLDSAFLFTMSASVLLVGVGQFVRWQGHRRGMRKELSDRIGFTLMGLLILVFWALPFDALEWLTGELDGNIEMFIVSGVWMVASGVWIVMYNADLITDFVQATLGKNRNLRPILKPAIAYPTSARFRTGLTVAMFALVIFTLMVFSILNNLGTEVVETPYKATGGFDIRAETSADLPVADMDAAITAAPELDRADFTVIAASSDLPGEARQAGADETRFLPVPVRGVDQAYLENVQFEMSHFDPSYLPDDIDTSDRRAVAAAIWAKLAEDPTLAVVSNSLLQLPAGGGPVGFGPTGFKVEGISQDDEEIIEAFEVTVRQRRSQAEGVQRTVIGALDPFAGSYESSGDGIAPGVITTSAQIFDEIADEPIPFTTFRFMLAEGVDADRTASLMETAFLDNSLLATDTFGEIETALAQNDAFGRLFQAFMGLGLVVGVASLGVLSFRAVVERRVSIGMMRAIGYKSRMIQVQFLLESVFVTVLGTGIGLGLGALISWNIVNSIQESFDGIQYTIPWLTVSIIVLIAVVAALLTTLIPARQASRIFPSEALRYE